MYTKKQLKNVTAGVIFPVVMAFSGGSALAGEYHDARMNDARIGVADTSSIKRAGHSLENVLRNVTIGGVDANGELKNSGVIAGPFRALYSLFTGDVKGFVGHLGGTVKGALDIPTDAIAVVYNGTVGNVLPEKANYAVNGFTAGLQDGMDFDSLGRVITGNSKNVGADLGYAALGLAANYGIGAAIANATDGGSSSSAAGSSGPVPETPVPVPGGSGSGGGI